MLATLMACAGLANLPISLVLAIRLLLLLGLCAGGGMTQKVEQGVLLRRVVHVVPCRAVGGPPRVDEAARFPTSATHGSAPWTVRRGARWLRTSPHVRFSRWLARDSPDRRTSRAR